MKKSLPAVISILAGLFLILACADAKPVKYHPGAEIPEGPGVFTQEAGAFTIYDSTKPAPAPKAAHQAEVPADSAEYQQFLQWQQDKKEFEQFQQWKQSPQGAKEYQEFQEWQRWRAFKKWQETQTKAE